MCPVDFGWILQRFHSEITAAAYKTGCITRFLRKIKAGWTEHFAIIRNNPRKSVFPFRVEMPDFNGSILLIRWRFLGRFIAVALFCLQCLFCVTTTFFLAFVWIIAAVRTRKIRLQSLHDNNMGSRAKMVGWEFLSAQSQPQPYLVFWPQSSHWTIIFRDRNIARNAS